MIVIKLKNLIFLFLAYIYKCKIYITKKGVTMEDYWKLTSIKVLSEIYKQFKMGSKAQNMTLQKLVNRSMWLFMNDQNFKDKIKDTKTLSEYYKIGY